MSNKQVIQINTFKCQNIADHWRTLKNIEHWTLKNIAEHWTVQNIAPSSCLKTWRWRNVLHVFLIAVSTLDLFPHASASEALENLKLYSHLCFVEFVTVP